MTFEILSEAIVSQWRPELQTKTWPQVLTNQLMQTKYQQDEWNFKI